MFPKRDLHFIEKPIVYELAKDGSNSCDFYCASGQLDGKRFANNYGGWPRSDLAAINEQTDLGVAKAMASRLETFDVKPSNVGMSDSDIMMAAKSKYCQAPAEQIAYFERMIAFRDAKIAYLQAQKKVLDEEKIVFNKEDGE